MIHSLILREATRLLVPLLLLFSLYLLMEGHSAPGGGFSAGLIGAGAYALYSIAFGVHQARDALPGRPSSLVVLGMLLVLTSGLMPAAQGRPFLDSLWWTIHMPGGTSFDFGTPYVFEAGIYTVVMGTVLSIVFELETLYTQLFTHETDVSESTKGSRETPS